MNNTPTIGGLIAALITPYNAYGGIDTDGVGQLVEYVLAGGVAGILVNSPYGEAAHLSRGERLFVVEAAREAAQGRVPLYAGSGATSTEETLALTWDLEKAGVTAAFITPPAYYRLRQAALRQHYRAILHRVQIPLVAYNAPTPPGNHLTSATMTMLATLPGIAAVVEGTPQARQLARTLQTHQADTPILGGYDPLAYAALAAGAVGQVSPLAGVLPAAMTAIVAAAADKDNQAQQLFAQLAPLSAFFTNLSVAVPACKAALSALGLPGGQPRAPLPPVSKADHAALHAALAQLPPPQ